MKNRNRFINCLLVFLALLVATVIPFLELAIDYLRNPLSETYVWGRSFLALSLSFSVVVVGPILAAVFIGIRHIFLRRKTYENTMPEDVK